MSPTRMVRHRPRSPALAIAGVLAVTLLLASMLGAAVARSAEEAPERAASPEQSSRAMAWRPATVPRTPAGGIVMWDVIAGGPGFIAVGGGWTDGAEESTAIIWVSDDGLTWQSVPLFGEAATGVPSAITITAEGFVAVGSGCCPDEAAVWFSPDGIAWERLPDQPAFAGTAMMAATTTPEGIVAVGCSAVMECFGGLAWTSPDGRTWSDPVPLPVLPVGVSATSAGILALGSSEPYEGVAASVLSADGTTWGDAVRLDAPGSLDVAFDVPASIDVGGAIAAFGGASDVASGDSDGLLLTSDDGETWEPLPSRRLRGVWVEDAELREDGILLAGWISTFEGQVPATMWTTDLVRFQPGRFRRPAEDGGLVHAVAFGRDGSTAVAVGEAGLDRGWVPAIWVSQTSTPEG